MPCRKPGGGPGKSPSVGKIEQAPEVRELLLGAELADVLESGPEIGAAAAPQLEMVHGTDEVVFVFDGNILPHRIVGLDEVEIHPMEEILPALQQSVRLSQKGPQPSSPEVEVAGVDDEGQLFYLLALPGLQRLDEGQVAVDRQAVGVKVQIELVRVEVDFLPGDAEPAQGSRRSCGGCGLQL